MNFNSNIVAGVEIALAASAAVGAKNQSGIVKAGLYATSAYLLFGAYLNTQKRIKVLPAPK